MYSLMRSTEVMFASNSEQVRTNQFRFEEIYFPITNKDAEFLFAFVFMKIHSYTQ